MALEVATASQTANQPRRNEPAYRTTTFERAAINENERTIEASISSEATRVRRWWGDEVLGHGPGEIRLQRIVQVGSFLFAHGRDPNHGVLPVGPIVRVWLDETERKLRAILKFDEDEASERLWQKVRSGAIRGISIGYDVYKVLSVKAGETARGFAGPVEIAVDWEPFEVSLEPTPADPNVGVGRAEGAEEAGKAGSGRPGNENERGDTGVDKDKEKDTKERAAQATDGGGVQPAAAVQPKPAEAVVADAKAVEERGIQAERQRVTEITTMCRTFGVSPEEYIAKGTGVAEVRAAILDKLAKERQAVPTAGAATASATGEVRVVTDEADKFSRAAADAILIRAGAKVEKPADGADAFRGMRLVDLAYECATRAGRKLARYHGDPTAILDAAFSAARDAGVGADSFPYILADVAHKAVAREYQAANTTFQTWAGSGEVRDFRNHYRVRLSEGGELELMDEFAPFRHDQVSEAREYVSIHTYGKEWTLTRQMIINDDLGAFGRLPQIHARAAARQINAAVYAVLIANGALSDGVALFHANHGNLAAGADVGAPGVATIGAAIAAMMMQTNIGGTEYLNIAPRYMLVPPQLLGTALQAMGDLDPSKSNATRNPWAGRLQIVADAVLGADSETAWYAAADPAEIDTIEVTYLSGARTPTVRSQASWKQLGMEYQMYFDWGVKCLDYRGLYKNPGA